MKVKHVPKRVADGEQRCDLCGAVLMGSGDPRPWLPVNVLVEVDDESPLRKVYGKVDVRWMPYFPGLCVKPKPPPDFVSESDVTDVL